MISIHQYIKKLDSDSFPLQIYALYMLSFGGQAIYSTYLNLYLSDIGYTQSQIGLTVSVSTFFVLLAQMVWGLIWNVFTRLIFGYLGGLASQVFGANYIMLTSSAVMIGATLLFIPWSLSTTRIIFHPALPTVKNRRRYDP